MSGGCLDAVGFGIMRGCKMNVRTRQNRMRSGRVAVWRRLTAARLVRSRNPTTSTPPLGSVPSGPLNIIATYGRSLYALVIGLFCGRWTLMALGEVDNGLMGVVGGLTVAVGVGCVGFWYNVRV